MTALQNREGMRTNLYEITSRCAQGTTGYSSLLHQPNSQGGKDGRTLGSRAVGLTHHDVDIRCVQSTLICLPCIRSSHQFSSFKQCRRVLTIISSLLGRLEGGRLPSLGSLLLVGLGSLGLGGSEGGRSVGVLDLGLSVDDVAVRVGRPTGRGRSAVSS